MLYLLIDIIYMICYVIYLSGFFIAEQKEKTPACKYKGSNLFFFGQILSKLNSTSKSMTLICLTLVLSAILFVTAAALTGWASGYLDVRSLYDIQISSSYNDVYDKEDLPRGNYDLVTEFMEEHQITPSYDLIFDAYLPRQEDFHNRYKLDFPVVAISLSDYNAIRKMLGYKQIELNENEFTTQWQTIAADEERTAFLSSHPTVSTDAGDFTLAGQAYYTDPIGEMVYNSYTDMIYILPDAACKKLLPVMRNRFIMTDEIFSKGVKRMYRKLTLRNIQRSIKDYMIYFVTITLTAALMYSFLALGLSEEIISISENMSILTSGILGLSALVALIASFVIGYDVQFMLTQRKKEFAAYELLGMESRSIQKLFFADKKAILTSLKTNPEISLAGTQLLVSEHGIYAEPMELYQMAGTNGYVLVVPDTIASQLSGNKVRLIMKLKNGGYPELKHEIRSFLQSGNLDPQLQHGKNTPERITMGGTVKAWGVENSLTGFTAISFCGRRLIQKEIGTFFFIPAILPAIITIILIIGANSLYGEAILQKNLIPFYGAVTLLIFFFLYMVYFMATSSVYKRSILK